MKHERVFDQDGIGRIVHPRVSGSEELIVRPISTRMVKCLSNVDLKTIYTLFMSGVFITDTKALEISVSRVFLSDNHIAHKSYIKEFSIMAISKEEATAKLVALRAEVEGLVSSYNEAYQTGKFEDAMKASNQMEEKVNEYTGIVRDMCFEDCKNSDNPMMTAVTVLSFVTIATKDEKKGDDKIPVRVVVEKERQIDLFKLHKYCQEKFKKNECKFDGIGADPQWLYKAENLNMLLTAQKAQDLGLDPKAVSDSFAMSNIAREIDLGKNPTSKTNMLKTLQLVITAMIGDGYKATSHDVNFLLSVYSKKNRKALTVTTANHKAMRGYLAEICHRIVTGKKYAVDYKAVKAQ